MLQHNWGGESQTSAFSFDIDDLPCKRFRRGLWRQPLGNFHFEPVGTSLQNLYEANELLLCLLLQITPVKIITCSSSVWRFIKSPCKNSKEEILPLRCPQMLSCTEIFIGPRCPWGPIYGSWCPSVRHYKTMCGLNWCDSGWEDSNSIPTEDVNMASGAI